MHTTPPFNTVEVENLVSIAAAGAAPEEIRSRYDALPSVLQPWARSRLLAYSTNADVVSELRANAALALEHLVTDDAA